MTAPIRVVLTRAHTHAGQAFKAGDRIEVAAHTADWLVSQGIARRPAPKPAPDTPPVQRKETQP